MARGGGGLMPLSILRRLGFRTQITCIHLKNYTDEIFMELQKQRAIGLLDLFNEHRENMFHSH